MTTYRIYALYALDEPLQVRYVGATKCPLAVRLQGHLVDPTNVRTAAWFADVQSRGIEIGIRELGSHHAAPEAAGAEKQWIKFWSIYCDLLNVSTGGYCPPSDTEITPEIRRLIRAAQDEINGVNDIKRANDAIRRCDELISRVSEKYSTSKNSLPV